MLQVFFTNPVIFRATFSPEDTVLEHLVKMSAIVVSFKFYKEPLTAVFLNPTENLSLHPQLLIIHLR